MAKIMHDAPVTKDDIHPIIAEFEIVKIVREIVPLRAGSQTFGYVLDSIISEAKRMDEEITTITFNVTPEQWKAL